MDKSTPVVANTPVVASTPVTAAANPPADFEQAIKACGFGCFNVFMFFVCSFCLCATVFSSSAMSYILPTAECDLHLSLVDKGMLNAVTYAGMIISAVPWGFIADTVGRKVVLVWGGWLDGIFVLCAALSQSPTQLMISKFFDGLIICGPFAVVVSYLAEFLSSNHRPYLMIFVGVMVSMASLLLPIIAYFLLPHEIRFSIWKLNFSTWHIFIAITSLPAFFSGFLHLFLPESPKFLLSQGRYEKAMLTFHIVYSCNSRKPKDTYPIKELTDATPKRVIAAEDDTRRGSLLDRYQRARSRFCAGLRQLKPMFSSPYLTLSLRVYIMYFCQIMSVNTIRLWMPQIFATMRHFDMSGANDTSMCAVLNHNAQTPPEEHDGRDHCAERLPAEAYVDNIFVACIGIAGFILLFPILRIKRVTNHILKVFLFIGILLVSGFYFSKSSICTLLLAASYLLVMGVCTTNIIYVSVVIFPTLMRTMVIVLIMTFGRIGSVCGNILFPVFIHLGCIAPFIWLTTLMLIAFSFSLFLPNSNKVALK